MKKSILSFLLLISAVCAKAQVDFTVNPFFLLIPGFQVSVEHCTKKDWGFAGDAFAAEGSYFLYASGRHFFNSNKGCDRFNLGAFAGGAGGGDNDSGFGLGFFIGYKAVSSQKIVFDIALGGGRDFTDNIEFLPYFKANVGYRFGLKKGE